MVVELLSTGVPGLDPELLSVAEIPENAQGLDMAAVLNTLPCVVDGSKDIGSEDELKRASPESLRREILRLAAERATLLEDCAAHAKRTQDAEAELSDTEKDRDALKVELAAAVDSLSLKSSRISELEGRLKSSPGSSEGAAGSGVAAVKALASYNGGTSSPPSPTPRAKIVPPQIPTPLLLLNDEIR